MTFRIEGSSDKSNIVHLVMSQDRKRILGLLYFNAIDAGTHRKGAGGGRNSAPHAIHIGGAKIAEVSLTKPYIRPSNSANCDKKWCGIILFYITLLNLIPTSTLDHDYI